MEVDKNDGIPEDKEEILALKSEQYLKFLTIMKDLDQYEKYIGTWEP